MTNNSKSMNNVMKSAIENFYKQNPCVSQLNKIQFTQNVFEVVHAHQIKEMHSTIAGVSDEYVLADHARYLQVPVDMWFEWTPEMRKDYVLGIRKLPVNDVFKQKDVPCLIKGLWVRSGGAASYSKSAMRSSGLTV